MEFNLSLFFLDPPFFLFFKASSSLSQQVMPPFRCSDIKIQLNQSLSRTRLASPERESDSSPWSSPKELSLPYESSMPQLPSSLPKLNLPSFSFCQSMAALLMRESFNFFSRSRYSSISQTIRVHACSSLLVSLISPLLICQRKNSLSLWSFLISFFMSVSCFSRIVRLLEPLSLSEI